MSVNSEILRIKNNIENSYLAAEGMGATILSDKNSNNLPSSLKTIEERVPISRKVADIPLSDDILQDDLKEKLEINEILKKISNYHHLLVGVADADGVIIIENFTENDYYEHESHIIFVYFEEQPTASYMNFKLQINDLEDTLGYAYKKIGSANSNDILNSNNFEAGNYYAFLNERNSYYLIGDLNREPLTTHLIDGIRFDGTKDISRFGICSTSADTVQKQVDIVDFKTSGRPAMGNTVYIQFEETNTADNPTLKINRCTALPIYYNGTNIPSGYLRSNKIYTFICNGTNFLLQGDCIDEVESSIEECLEVIRNGYY